ncbi:heme exporter protein CcmD [Rhodobaculum claviforme]|uniref:Heme exporter protein D n=1 Tax=Rhodobaculum claviforme TaxID=1549854 RepID=A0A934TJC1_9RHOB|nr:heme exporter protein CcmD [Rhodobaculum claviforme]MBK5926546.1 heme exporter protein CcmD [Rhodobaculum claviforme]
MPDLGPYWLEVLASYIVSLVILAGLVALIWRRSARVHRDLSKLEARSRAAPRTGEHGNG